MDELFLARLLCPWDSPGRNTGEDCHALSPGHLPNPGIEPVSPALQTDSLPSEPTHKPGQDTALFNIIPPYSLCRDGGLSADVLAPGSFFSLTSPWLLLALDLSLWVWKTCASAL